MIWDKLNGHHFHDQPVDHVLAKDIYDLRDYDRLYENQNNLNHQSWKEFCEKYNTKAYLRESFSDIDLSNDIICLWFFKERSDQMASYVHLKGKQKRYYPNTFLITKEKDIKFVPTKRKYIRTPLIQLDMDIKTYTNIAKRFQK